MKNFSVKNINFVGVAASFLAFVFTFLPFYSVKPTAYFYNYSGTASLFSKTKSLAQFNFFGILCIILALAEIAIFVLNTNQKVKLVGIGLAILNFSSLMLAVIVGNSDIQDLKSSVASLVHFSGSSYSVDTFIKASLESGFTLELIMILIMIASYWIDGLLVKPILFNDKTGAHVNPFKGVDTKSHSIRFNKQHIIKAMASSDNTDSSTVTQAQEDALNKEETEK